MYYIISGKIIYSNFRFSLLDQCFICKEPDIIFTCEKSNFEEKKQELCNMQVITSPFVTLAKIYMSSSYYYILFEDSLLIYGISKSRDHVCCFFDPKCNPQRIEIDYLLYVHVFMQLLEGKIPLHASCCQLPCGQCIAFIGPSGAGKSTMVQAMHAYKNCKIISDDTVFIEVNTETSYVHPSIPIVKSFPKQDELIDDIILESIPVWDKENKSIHVIKHDLYDFYIERKIDYIFIIDDESEKISVSAMKCTGENLLTMFSSLFAGYLIPVTLYRSVFEQLAQLLNTGIVHTICYPRKIDKLKLVVDYIHLHTTT